MPDKTVKRAARKAPPYKGSVRHNYGKWNGIVRGLAKDDVDAMKRIARWPIREAILAFWEMLREDASESYYRAAVLYGLGVSGKHPPKRPQILSIKA